MVYKQKEEHKRKIGLANSIILKGQHVSPKTEFKKDRISERKGKQFINKQGEKISMANKGKIAWNKGGRK